MILLQAIRSEVILRDNAADGVQIRYFTNCLDPFDELKETRVCGGLGVGNIVNYTVSINVIRTATNETFKFLIAH